MTRRQIPSVQIGNMFANELDWNLPDAELARMCGVTRSRMGQVRSQLNIPKASLFRTHGDSIQMHEWIRDHQQDLRERARKGQLSVEDVVEEAGIADVGVSATERMLTFFRISCPVARHRDPYARYRLLNWDLPNRDLAEIWGLHAVRVAKYRRLLVEGRTRWSARSVNSPRYRQENPAHYKLYERALAAERVKALQHRPKTDDGGAIQAAIG